MVLQPDAIAQLKTNTTPGDYWVFQNTLTDMHNIIHGAVGGDLGGDVSPANPAGTVHWWIHDKW